MKRPYVFISYSSKESDAANLVHSYLESNGISCWIASRNIEGGESFAAQIVDAIQDCSAFVMIASPASNESDHVSNELSLAFSAKKKIIPLRLKDLELSKSNTYFLQQAQWIDAFDDMTLALKRLLVAVRNALPEVKASPAVQKVDTPAAIKKETASEDTGPALTRDEIVNILLDRIEKYPYCLKSRTRGEGYEAFKKKAKVLFDHTVATYYRGRLTSGGIDFVDMVVDVLSQGNGVSIQVKGLPGCAKNMLLQLAYYKMLDRFRRGESDHLPLYLSSSYYEKLPYSAADPRKEMTEAIRSDSAEYLAYVKRDPKVRPVLMVEAVREHVVSRFAPDDVIMDLWRPFGKFNRIVAMDVGLIKNRHRLKRSIPLLGDTSGYTFRFHSVPITGRAECLTVIRTILDMYDEQYEGLDPVDIYNALYRLRFSTVDIFSIRLVATELAQGLGVDEISLTDMYERLAMNELKGDDGRMLSIAHELYEYVFNERHDVRTQQYNAVMWSLPHKHSTYLEFMVAYYFSHKIMRAQEEQDYRFLRISMTSMENHFMSSRLRDNYLLQETLLGLITREYQGFDMRQKGNAVYWLGKISYADLKDAATQLLEEEFNRLKPLVKNDRRQTLQNRYQQYLFRSVCHGLIGQGRTGVLDDYLCLVVTNDVANAINRGIMIEYLGDNHQIGTHNDFYLDQDPNIGEQAIRILCSRVESQLMQKRAGFVETDLVSLLTLVQARMHAVPEGLAYNLVPFCKKCLELLEEYHKRPRNIISGKLIYYFRSIADDMTTYVDRTRIDVAYAIYSDLSKMREVKRIQWLEFGVEDPESIAEHTLSAWMMAMVFLPLEHPVQGYDKREIMDMLMIHDMAEAILGDIPSQLSEPTKELKRQNDVLRRLFLKGTYPEVADLTHYYNVWTGYFNGQNINARIARDINLIQTVETFFSYCVSHPQIFTADRIKGWLEEGNKLSTDLGHELFERIISRNPVYRKIIDRMFAAENKS